MGRFRVAILICSYNEEKTIRKIVKEASKVGNVFLIDDCSDDQTKKKLKNLKVNYYRNNKNIGYEKSLEKGFNIIKKKNYDFLVTMDADGQHKISSVKSFVYRIKKYDMVVGSRKNQNNFLEKILSYFSRKYLGIDDILCGLKAYRLSKFMNLKNNQSNIIGTKYLFYAFRNNLKVSQLKISCNSRQSGKSRYYSNIFNYFKILNLIYNLKNFQNA